MGYNCSVARSRWDTILRDALAPKTRRTSAHLTEPCAAEQNVEKRARVSLCRPPPLGTIACRGDGAGVRREQQSGSHSGNFSVGFFLVSPTTAPSSARRPFRRTSLSLLSVRPDHLGSPATPSSFLLSNMPDSNATNWKLYNALGTGLGTLGCLPFVFIAFQIVFESYVSLPIFSFINRWFNDIFSLPFVELALLGFGVAATLIGIPSARRGYSSSLITGLAASVLITTIILQRIIIHSI